MKAIFIARLALLSAIAGGATGACANSYKTVDLGLDRYGMVVGYSYLDDSEARAFAWKGGVMTNLGALPGDTSSYATAVDDAGAIVGASGSDAGNFDGGVIVGWGVRQGKEHGFMLIPR